MSDYWIVGKLSNLREFFVVIQQKNASIIEIDGKATIIYKLTFGISYNYKYDHFVEEVKRLCDQELKSIFFY